MNKKKMFFLPNILLGDFFCEIERLHSAMTLTQVVVRLSLVFGSLAVVGDMQSTGRISGHASLTPLYTPEIFSRKIEERPHFVMFYAPWCGHCKRLTGTFDQLADKYNVDNSDRNAAGAVNAVVAKVDCTQHTALCSENDIIGYPTLLFYWSNQKVHRKYKGSRDYKSLDEFVKTMTKEGPMKQVDVPMKLPVTKKIFRSLELTDETFDAHIATGQHFVDFYAPWCGHCKELAPIWADLQKTYENDPFVTIVSIDCTKYGQLCIKHSVRGYPSLVYFNNGIKVHDYRDARDLTTLVAFVSNFKTRLSLRISESTEELIPEDHGKAEPPRPRKPVVPSVVRNRPLDYVPHTSEFVRELDKSNFASAILESGHQFILFFAPWCVHCQLLSPTFLTLAELLQDESTLTFSQVDCSANQQICGEYDVNAYPTLVFIADGRLIDRYGGPRELDDLRTYLIASMKYSPVTGPIPASSSTPTIAADPDDEDEASGVIRLTEATFVIKTKFGFTFINYFQPWCDHCKQLAPVWAELGREYVDDVEMKIASVNCDEEFELCKNNEVNQYPSLILYLDGEPWRHYEGQRDLKSFTEFLRHIVQNVRDEL